MAATRITFNIAHAENPSRDQAPRIGPEGDGASVFVLNGRGRAFATRGAGGFSIKWIAEGRARYEAPSLWRSNRRPR
jgi:hypothetical protein